MYMNITFSFINEIALSDHSVILSIVLPCTALSNSRPYSASTVITYTLYTVADETVSKFGTDRLKYTIPFVLYGIFRYLYLIHQKNEGGSPEKVLLNDFPLLLCILLYGITVGLILYL